MVRNNVTLYGLINGQLRFFLFYFRIFFFLNIGVECQLQFLYSISFKGLKENQVNLRKGSEFPIQEM